MADTTGTASPSPKKRRGWLRLLAWIAGGFAVLLLVVYLVATSAAFLKSAILPRVSAALNAEVTVSDASIHPFGSVTLRDLKVQSKEEQPLVTAPEVRLSYSLMDILGGNLNISEIALVSPTVELSENPDGGNNLDPILNALKAKPAEPKVPAAKSSKPVQLHLGKLTLSNATLLKIKNYKGGLRDVLAVTNLNVTLSNVQNGQTGSLEVSAAARVENNSPAAGATGLLEAALKGSFTFALTADLQPASAKGELHANITRTAGSFADFAALGAALNCEVTTTDIKDLALRFSRGDTRLGELRVSGPFDAGKMEGRLNVELSHIDRQVLNLAQARSGIDFGTTTINSTNQIQLSKAGAVIEAAGGFSADKLQFIRNGQTPPTVDFRADYDVTVDRTAQTASLRKLTLTATQDANPLLNAQLSQPMNLGWGSGANATGDSALDLAITRLNLADWKAFTGSAAPTGTVGLKLRVASQQGGKQIAFDLNSDITNLAAHLGSNEISQADVDLEAHGQAANLKQIHLGAYSLRVALQKQTALTVSGAADYNLADGAADARVKVQAALAQLAQLAPQPGVSGVTGDTELNLHLTQTNRTQTFELTSTSTNLSAKTGTNQIPPAGVNLEARGRMADLKQLTLDGYKLQLLFHQQSALDVSGSGTFNLADGSADLQVKLQAALARLIAAVPQPGLSVSAGDLGLTAHITQKDKAQSVTGTLTLADFTGQTGNNKFQNYATKLDLDVANSPAQILIRKLAGSLSQGGKAGGTFDVSGSYQPAKKLADFSAKLADLNQNALSPFLAPLLADKALVSVAINAALSGQYDPAGPSSIKGGVQVTNLVVSDPQQKLPATALEAKVDLDASLQKQSADLRQFQITLTPTDRAQNRLNLQGKVDFSQTTNVQGNLQLTADSLDMTRYYDLFAGKSKAAQTKPLSPNPGQAETNSAAAPNVEPGPVSLPFLDFKVGASIGKFYLREMEITNLAANLTLNRTRILVKPLQLALNGAPVSATADLDLGAPAWTYDVSLNATRIPVLPLANSFVAAANGKYDGFVSASAQVKGRGVTGINLKQSLNGMVLLTLTNANLQVLASQTKIFFIPINVKLIATLLNIPEIMQAPLTGVNARINAGSGQIDVQQAQVVGPVFLANVHGVIPIADVLNDSPLNLPVELALTNTLAAKLAMSNTQSAPAPGFSQLPVFLTVGGTIGNLQTKKDGIALAALTIRAGSGLVGGAAGGAAGEALKLGGGVVKGLEGLLGGSSAAGGTQNTNTSTNAPGKLRLFNPFKR